MQNNKLVALIGAAAVIIGVFSPLINIPFFGAISYASQKQGEGFLMIGGALAAALLCYLLNLFWPSVVTGILVLADVLLTLINLHHISGEMGDSSNLLIKAFANTLSPSWGFALLLIGGILLIVSACLEKWAAVGAPKDKSGLYHHKPLEVKPIARQENWFGNRPAFGGEVIANAFPPAPGSWQLVGRALAGRTFQLTVTSSMFDHQTKRLVLGRMRAVCDVVVNDETVSRQHAHIRLTPSGFTVADRNSANGTAVNGQFSRRPFEERPLKIGDTLTLGEVKLDFRQA